MDTKPSFTFECCQAIEDGDSILAVKKCCSKQFDNYNYCLNKKTTENNPGKSCQIYLDSLNTCYKTVINHSYYT